MQRIDSSDNNENVICIKLSIPLSADFRKNYSPTAS